MKGVKLHISKLYIFIETNIFVLFLIFISLTLAISIFRTVQLARQNNETYLAEYDSYQAILSENQELKSSYEYFKSDIAKINSLREIYNTGIKDEILIQIKDNVEFLDVNTTFYNKIERSTVQNLWRYLL